MAYWHLEQPWLLEPTGMGANSVNWFVATPTGRYVLRIAKHATRAGIRAEQQVLKSLSQQSLAFALPVVVPTKAGVGYVPLSSVGVYAVLAWRLPGEIPRTQSPAQLHEAGVALGKLVQALSRVPHPESQLRYLHLGSFARYLPPHLTSRTALDAASRKVADQQKLTAFVERVEAAIPSLYRTLPRQLVHCDYVPCNVLMKDGRVSAVLDFKLLAQLRLAWGVIYALGRFLSGAGVDDWLLVFLAHRALSLEDWLVRHEDELVARALRWVTEA